MLFRSGLVRAFAAVADADPAQKATLLAEGISTSMWATVVTLPIAGLLDLGAIAACVIGSVRKP